MATAKEKAESDLRQLLLAAHNLPVDKLESCIDWVNEKLNKSKKILDQIEKIQRQIPYIDSKLFNDSRDCCDTLRNWLKRLEEHRKALLDKEQTIIVQTLDELGSLNDGFKRSRKFLCSK